jgi:hypothetical protein
MELEMATEIGISEFRQGTDWFFMVDQMSVAIKDRSKLNIELVIRIGNPEATATETHD